jgi:GNAT superfamily N-acetyltransferase
VLLDVEPVTETHLERLHALFERASCPCYCRYWHFRGTKNDWLERCAERPGENAAELDHAVRARASGGHGLVALTPDSGAIVGWMKLELRAELPKLRGLPVYRGLHLGDDAGTLVVGCFLVDPLVRKAGVARALVRAAPAIAREWGAKAIEAYPRRSTDPLYPEEVWQGPERVFVEAGFTAVHDVGPYPVYRLTL